MDAKTARQLQEGVTAAGEGITRGLNSAKINSPIPSTLVDECDKCANIIMKFSQPRSEDQKVLELADQNEYTKQLKNMIPKSVLKGCKGVAILTVLKAGAAFSGRAGSGLVVAKLESGEWSAPSAIGVAGVGFGFQFGAEITDYIFVLNTDAAVEAFYSPNVTLGGFVY
jgi:lipid-binding SYLF domain-containing protein